MLSTDTGHRRDYSRNPYEDYFASKDLMFAVKPLSRALPAKERVLGIWTEREARAYSQSAFHRERLRVEDEIDGQKITIDYNPAANSLRLVEGADRENSMYAFWFAWYAFHPHSSVFE